MMNSSQYTPRDAPPWLYELLRKLQMGQATQTSLHVDLTGTVQTVSDSIIHQHHDLSGLPDDDHPQYLLLAGRVGNQSANGGTLTGGTLTLSSTAHATKGTIIFGTAAVFVWDEVNGRLGIGLG